METKYMESKQMIEFDNNHGFELEYHLIEKWQEDFNDEPLYGVQITKTENDSVEVERFDGITHSKELASDLLTKLLTHTITPIVMLEVIDEFISEYV